jgi:hypothetical protein
VKITGKLEKNANSSILLYREWMCYNERRKRCCGDYKIGTSFAGIE